MRPERPIGWTLDRWAAHLEERVEELEALRSNPDENSTIAGKQPTSKAAALDALPRSGTQRRRILDFLRLRSVTDEQLADALSMSMNTVRPRRGELVKGGWIRDSGERRPSRAGNDSIVWEAIH